MYNLFFEFSDYLIDISYIGDIGLDLNTPKLFLHYGAFNKEFIKFQQADDLENSKLHIKCMTKEIILTHKKLTHYGDVLCIYREDSYQKRTKGEDPSGIQLKLLSKRKTRTGDVKVAIGSLFPANDIFEFLHPIRNVFILFTPLKTILKKENPFPFNERDLKEWDLPLSSDKILKDVLERNESLRSSTVIILSLIWRRSLQLYDILKDIFSEEVRPKLERKLDFLSILYKECPWQNKLFKVFFEFLSINVKNEDDKAFLDQLYALSQAKSIEPLIWEGKNITFEEFVLIVRARYPDSDIAFVVESIVIELFGNIWNVEIEGYDNLIYKKFNDLYMNKIGFDRFSRYLLKILTELRYDFGYRGFYYMMKLIIKNLDENPIYWQSHKNYLSMMGELLNTIEDYCYIHIILNQINKGNITMKINYLELIKKFINQIQRRGFFDFDQFLFAKYLEIANLKVDENEKRNINLLEHSNKNEIAFFINRYNLLREDLITAQTRIMNHANFLRKYHSVLTLEMLFTDLVKVSKVAIISDIHANLEAFQSVLQDIDDQDIDFIFCLGDIIGYGPNPKEVLELSRIFDFILMGNHENAIFNSDKGFNAYAKEAIEWTRSNIGHTDITTLSRFLKGMAFGDYVFIHASPKHPFYEYINNPKIAQDNFLSDRFKGRKYCFYGHTHLTGIYYFSMDDGKIHFDALPVQERENKREEFTFDLKKYDKALINIGSVGQPRDRDNRACYVILENDTIRFIRLRYDINAVIKKIRSYNLPKILAERLRIGR